MDENSVNISSKPLWEFESVGYLDAVEPGLTAILTRAQLQILRLRQSWQYLPMSLPIFPRPRQYVDGKCSSLMFQQAWCQGVLKRNLLFFLCWLYQWIRPAICVVSCSLRQRNPFQLPNLSPSLAIPCRIPSTSSMDLFSRIIPVNTTSEEWRMNPRTPKLWPSTSY